MFLTYQTYEGLQITGIYNHIAIPQLRCVDHPFCMAAYICPDLSVQSKYVSSHAEMMLHVCGGGVQNILSVWLLTFVYNDILF